jgi:hypothetical protein
MKRPTVKLRIEAPGFYRYNLLRPPASIRDPACNETRLLTVQLIQTPGLYPGPGL